MTPMEELIEKIKLKQIKGSVYLVPAIPIDFFEEALQKESDFLESYFQHRVNEITDEMIKEHFSTQSFHYKDGRNYKIKNNHIAGAKWFKQKLIEG